MAKRQFMSKRPSGRNPLSKKTSTTRRPWIAPSGDLPVELVDPDSSPLSEAIETERVRLYQAHCVLHCLHVALLYDDGDPLTYADAVKVSRELVSEALDQLDSARLHPLIQELHKSTERATDAKP